MLSVETDPAWARALRDPSLRDLPYKIETNEFGQLVMSPHKLKHSRVQPSVLLLLAEMVEDAGVCAVEYAVRTSKGVKVPDVVWVSDERRRQIPDDAEASPIAPEICIEVLSESNTHAGIDEKRRLYFEHEAEEVWMCDLKGRMRFFHPSGEKPASGLVPGFPSEIEV